MSKINLIPDLIHQLTVLGTQEDKLILLQKYEKETLLKRVLVLAYNPWINFKLQHYVPRHSGKQYGMGLSRFMHVFDEINENKLTTKEAEFSFSMAFLHINTTDASLLLALITQTLDVGLELSTINAVWPNLITVYPLRTAHEADYTQFNTFPAAIQPCSTGLRVNIIVCDKLVSYRNKDGTVIDGWDQWDDQFVNLAQGQNTVFDGHALVASNSEIEETDNDKVIAADPTCIRFTLWDVIRYDGFIAGEDTRIGYNWRYNGLEHMMMLAMDKNPTPCYNMLKADMVGSADQLEAAINNYSKAVIKSLDSTWATGTSPYEIISYAK